MCALRVKACSALLLFFFKLPSQTSNQESLSAHVFGTCDSLQVVTYSIIGRMKWVAVTDAAHLNYFSPTAHNQGILRISWAFLKQVLTTDTRTYEQEMADLSSVVSAGHRSQEQTHNVKHQEPDKPRLWPLHLQTAKTDAAVSRTAYWTK